MKYELPDGILKKEHDPAEYRLQVACMDYLRGQRRMKGKTYPLPRPFPQLYTQDGHQRFTHIAAGRNKEDGFFLQQMGLRRGVFDLFLWPGFFGFIDLKATGNLTREQLQFADDMRGNGAKVATARSVAEFRDTLVGWNLKCVNPTVFEPEPPAHVKQAAWLEAMKPIN